VAILASGCSLFQKKPAADTQMTGADTYSDPYANSGAAPTYTDTATASYPTTTGGTRYHTVARKETLFALARQYYGDQSKWRTIYDANRAAIGEDPNKIRVGQQLIIP